MKSYFSIHMTARMYPPKDNKKRPFLKNRTRANLTTGVT